MLYFLILALQGFCIYHTYKNRNEHYWYYLIIFLPVIGCVIYLLTQVFSKGDISKIQTNVVNVVNPTKKITDLQKRVQFSDTYQNRVLLADAYLQIKDYNHAIEQYEYVLKGNYKSDVPVAKRLLEAYFYKEDFSSVIKCAKQIKESPIFKGSESQFFYGLALENLGESSKAEENLRAIDQRYSNYSERLQLAKYYLDKEEDAKAKEILNEISEESQHFSKPNRKKYRQVVAEVRRLNEGL